MKSSLLSRLGVGVLTASALALAPIAAAGASAQVLTTHVGAHVDKATKGLFTTGIGKVGDGTGAVLPDGTIVTAATGSDESRIDVCTMSPDPTKCSAKPVLDAYKTDTFGVPQVVPTGGKDVAIVVEDCCYIGDDGILVFNSTNDGKTFSKYVIAGDLSGVASAVYVGDGHIVISDSSTGTIEVQEISDHPTSPTGVHITPPHKGDNEESAVTSYKGGVLLATCDGQVTTVDYAKSGSNYATRSAWKKETTIRQATLDSLSGTAILIQHSGNLTGAERVQFFNGHSYGTAYRVSQPPDPDDGGFVMQETGSVAHVFYIARRESYRLYEVSTSNGTWSKQTAFAAVGDNNDYAPALGSNGKGAVLIADGTEAIQPINSAQ